MVRRNKINAVVSEAQLMTNYARSIGLDVQFERDTAGDGSCGFYHSIIEQIHRYSIMPLIEPNLLFSDHVLLRRAVVSFVREN